MTENRLNQLLPKRSRRDHWLAVTGTMVAIFLTLSWISGRNSIPPLVESDYAYQLMAADRVLDGHGLTALQPVAPGQPWSWSYDWGFLTQWPFGYSLLVAGVRRLLGVSSLAACAWINSAAAAVALVGWFLWLRRCAPPGLCGLLLAMAGAASAVTPAMLINPSTDNLLVAGLPWLLLLGMRRVAWPSAAPPCASEDMPAPNEAGLGHATPDSQVWACQPTRSDLIKADDTHTPDSRVSPAALIFFGVLAGALCWFRYAAIFVPVALATALLVERVGKPAARWRRTLWFGTGVIVPVGLLLITNAVFAPGGDLQQQLNLGYSFTPRLESRWLVQAWMRWTNLGYYDYLPLSHSMLAALPGLLLLAAMAPWEFGHRVRMQLAAPPFRFSLLALVTGMGLIIVSTALFGGKFNYVELDRYYLPLRPLYFTLVAAPLLAGLAPLSDVSLSRARWVKGMTWLGRGTAAMILVIALWWSADQEWMRTLARWREAKRPVTAYGQWSRCFTPNANDLFAWLREAGSPELIVASNFHEFIALETGLPAIPVPPSSTALNEWMERIRIARKVDRIRVFFVLDADNRWRDYWIEKPEEIIQRFDLVPADGVPARIVHWVFEPRPAVMVSTAQP